MQNNGATLASVASSSRRPSLDSSMRWYSYLLTGWFLGHHRTWRFRDFLLTAEGNTSWRGNFWDMGSGAVPDPLVFLGEDRPMCACSFLDARAPLTSIVGVGFLFSKPLADDWLPGGWSTWFCAGSALLPSSFCGSCCAFPTSWFWSLSLPSLAPSSWIYIG